MIWVPSPPSRPKRNEVKSCLIEMDLIRNHILSPCEVELWFAGAISKVAFLYLMLLDTPGCENEGLEVGRRGNKKAQNSLLVLAGVVNSVKKEKKKKRGGLCEREKGVEVSPSPLCKCHGKVPVFLFWRNSHLNF